MKLVGVGGRLEAPLFRGDNMDSSSKAPWSSQGYLGTLAQGRDDELLPLDAKSNGRSWADRGSLCTCLHIQSGTPARFEEPAGENAPHC
jgi:hypothetical protein